MSNIAKIVEEFELKVSTMTTSSALNYKKAIDCFNSFVEAYGCVDEHFSKLINDWVLHMSMIGLSYKTTLHYLDIFSSLCNAISRPDRKDVLSSVKSAVRNIGEEKWRRSVNEAGFSKLINLTRVADRQKGLAMLYSDIILISLLNRGMDVTDVAMLQKDNIAGLSSVSQKVLARHLSSRRKYVFQLNQSSLTVNGLKRKMNSALLQFLRSRDIMTSDDVSDTLKSYWAFAALRCGASGPVAKAGLDWRSPDGLSALSLFDKESIDVGNLESVSDEISDLFTCDPGKWFAMRLRPRVTYQQLVERINDSQLKVAPQLFYPGKEIAVRVGKKLVFKNRPLLADIVFFKSRVTDIQPLFYVIGDLAWCYKTGDSFSPIPRASMELFQKSIGQFTPDYEVAPAGSLRLRPGDKVVVVGGAMAGNHGEILEEINHHDGVIYRISLLGGSNDIEWRVKDTRLIERR